MQSNRTVILGVLGAVCLIVLAWNWISGWGLVTVEVDDARLGDVIRSIERQGGVKILTRVDPETLVSMDVYRVPPVEAVEVLAARLDGSWSVVFVGGPTEDVVKRGVASLAEEGRGDREFRRISYPSAMMGVVSETVPDPRRIDWKVSPNESVALQGYLDQAAQKTGVTIVVPEAWNPDLARAPKGGRADRAVPAAIAQAGGKSDEVFLLAVWGGWGGGEPRAGGGSDRQGGGGQNAPAGGPPAVGAGQRSNDGGQAAAQRGRSEPNPEWVAERVLGEIAQLPAGEQEAAKKEFDEMRAFWEEVRAMPEGERRAAVEQFFENPQVQARMDEREAIRDARRGADRRTDRARRYVERKASAKSS